LFASERITPSLGRRNGLIIKQGSSVQMPESSVSSLVQVILTFSIGGALLYPLYPDVDALNHTYAPFFVLAVGLVLAAAVVLEVGGSQGSGGPKKVPNLIRIMLLSATFVIATLVAEFLSGASSLQMFVTLAVVAIVVLLAVTMS
jgi:hypothetical protein